MEYEEVVHRCFRCGFCKFTSDYMNFNCPSYLKYRFESYAPGGRMWLLKAWLDGEISASQHLGEIFYSCTSCGNCKENCVMEFRDDLLNIFTAARGELVADGRIPPQARDYFKNLHTYGNPYKKARNTRASWAKGLDVPEYDGQEWLLYIGCVGSFDERGQKMAHSLANLLLSWDVSFGILGEEETCDGNEAQTMGEQGLFQLLATRNKEIFDRRGVRQVIALSPHGYHAFKNEYSSFGIEIHAVHYSQFLASEIEKRRDGLGNLSAKTTYHDPCYLGRHNKIYQEPRHVLSAIPGVVLEEMERSQKEALCCGGGDGNFFTDILGSGVGCPARIRVREAAATGAEILAVACPSCAKMFEDAVKAEANDARLRVMDLSEILLEASGAGL